MLKRLFDIASSCVVLIVLLPLLLLISAAIAADSSGGVFYRQERVGRNGRIFRLIKFRTMVARADQEGLLTVGQYDRRITRIGSVLRRYKLDELPQLINVVMGDMSVVGPRPEVPYYVKHYTTEQMRVLSVRPGLTDPASMAYLKENEILAASDTPELTYLETVMPEKLRLSLEYVDKQSILSDLRIILKTLGKIFSAKPQ